jgi:hypothetical protein
MTGPVDKLLLYARTFSHLRPRQAAYWPLRRLQQRMPLRIPAVPAAVLAAGTGALAAEAVAWGPGDAAERIARADAVRAGTFTFLNHAERLDPPDWRARYQSELWTMNLHYFDYAVDLAWAWRLRGDAGYLRRLEALAEGWMRGALPAPGERGREAWEAYSLSKRVANWTLALLLAGDALDAGTRGRMLASLYAQAGLLARRVEHHIQANHLQANYRGLVFAGLLLDGPAARGWLRAGERGTWNELRAQVLPDGTHFERSSLYHLLSLSDFLECAALLRAAGRSVPDAAVQALRGMARAAGVLCRPDGTLHLFNDSANGIAPPLAEVSARAEAVLGEPVTPLSGAAALPDAGYYAYADAAAGERMVVDCGEPGPLHQPGHAHCDLLSYELDLAGRPVVVDSGVRGYLRDPLRAYVRSTRAHNTVVIGGKEQSEVWSTYRLARRARLREARFGAADGFRLEGAYSPYHDPRCVHRRVVQRQEDGWRIEDRVQGAAGATLQGFVHLHPDFAVRVEGERVYATAGTVEVVVDTFGADAVRVHRGVQEPAQGWYCPEFGMALPAPVVELRVERNDGRPFGYVVRQVGR